MKELVVLLALLLACGCSTTRQEEKKAEVTTVKEGNKAWNFTATAQVPITLADGTVKTTPVSVKVSGKEQAEDHTKEESSRHTSEQTKSTIDTDAIANAVADKLAPVIDGVISTVPGGSSMNAIIGAATGGTGLLGALVLLLRNRKLGTALSDAVEFGKDAISQVPPQQAVAIGDKHRDKQRKNKTHDIIHSKL